MFRAATIVLSLCASRALGCGTALLLLVDVSNSVDPGEYRLQADGLAHALSDPSVSLALRESRSALAVMQWSGVGEQSLYLPWTVVKDAETAASLAESLRRMPRAYTLSGTAPGEALLAALSYHRQAPDCGRNVIDISGDGTPNAGIGVSGLSRLASRRGVTINGLAIEDQGRGLPITTFYRRHLITSDGFVMTARGFESFAETLRRKMIRETSIVVGQASD